MNHYNTFKKNQKAQIKKGEFQINIIEDKDEDLTKSNSKCKDPVKQIKGCDEEFIPIDKITSINGE